MYRGPRKCDAGFGDFRARILGCGRPVTRIVHGWDLAFCDKHAHLATECERQLNIHLDRMVENVRAASESSVRSAPS